MALRKADEVHSITLIVPKFNYSVRVESVEKKPSSNPKNGNWIRLNTIIYGPEQVLTPHGDHVNPAGTEVPFYAMIDIRDPKQSNNLTTFFVFLRTIGFKPIDNIYMPHPENPSLDSFDDDLILPRLDGITFDAQLESTPVYKSLSGNKYGAKGIPDRVLDHEGKPILTGYQLLGDLSKVTGPASIPVPAWMHPHANEAK